jgi:hypothetical protein
MSNYTLTKFKGTTMSETIKINDRKKVSGEKPEGTTEHTCACGEMHEHIPGVSHREECTSPQKFGDTCCCGSGQPSKARTLCGHGPRCH